MTTMIILMNTPMVIPTMVDVDCSSVLRITVGLVDGLVVGVVCGGGIVVTFSETKHNYA